MNGWFAVRRGISEHPVFRHRMDRLGFFVWMIERACWKETPFDIHGKTITLKRGQFCASYAQMSEATGLSVKEIRNLFKRLKVDKVVGIEGGKGRTIVTLCNYEKYQSAIQDGGKAKGKRGASEGQAKEQSNKDITLEANASNGAEAPVPVNLISSALWQVGKQFLASKEVKDPGKIIGMWIRDYKDPLRILSAIESAQRVGTEDPVPYITKALQPNAEPDLEALLANVNMGGR